MTEPKNIRAELRGKYHGVILASIAKQNPITIEEDGKPRTLTLKEAIAAYKEFFRVKYHPGESTEAMSDERFAWLVSTVEAEGASEMNTTYPAQQPEESR